MTSFLTPSDICDFRGFVAGSPTSGDFKISDFQNDETLEIIVDHDQLAALYQSDDVFQWSRRVAQFKPEHRSRILTGFWPTTFGTADNQGKNLPGTPCFGYMDVLAPSLSIITSTAAGPTGVLAAAGYPPTSPLASIAITIFTNVVLSADQLFPADTAQKVRRDLMAHEYGHFLFCSLLYNEHPTAVDHIGKAWAANGIGSDFSQPFQYINEGFAEFISGQVAGAADYLWRNNIPTTIASTNGFTVRGSGACLGRGCFDLNINQNSLDTDSKQLGIGRIATLLMDAYDGRGARFTLVPGNGDMWTGSAGTAASLSPVDYDNIDNGLERVALSGNSLVYFGGELGALMGPLDPSPRDVSLNDATLFLALNATMAAERNNWCERCRVFALHSPLRSGNPTVQDLWSACVRDGNIGPSVGPPPEASLRLDANTCTPCPPQYWSNENGVCTFCADTLIGNNCGKCVPDVVVDADLIRTDLDVTANVTAPNDFCPNVFWLRIDRPGQVYAHSASTFVASAEAADVTSCDRTFTLFAQRSSESMGRVELPTLVDTTFSDPYPLLHCGGTFPARDFWTESHDPDTSALWIGTPLDSRTALRVRFEMPPGTK